MSDRISLMAFVGATFMRWKSHSPAPLTPEILVVHPSVYDSVGSPAEMIAHSYASDRGPAPCT